MSRPRDNQRKRMYNSEIASGLVGRTFKSTAEIQSYVDKILRSAWWKRRYPWVYRINVKTGRGYRSYAYTYPPEMSITKYHRDELSVLHEIAHIITPPNTAPHGPEFARLYLDLVRWKLGASPAAHLRRHFRKHRVRVATASSTSARPTAKPTATSPRTPRTT